MILTPPFDLNVRVEGDGLLRLLRGGKPAYAREARLTIVNGVLCTGDGAIIVPKIALSGPFAVALDGTVTVNGATKGRLVLALVANGKTILANPGEGLAGVLRTGKPLAIKTTPKAASARVTIAVRPRTEIEGERILLGDVADIAAPAALKIRLAKLDLGRTPPLGATRFLGKTYVAALVRGLGLKPEAFDLDCPPNATALAAGQTVEAQTILDTALSAPGAEGLVAARPPSALALPKGELALAADPIVRGPAGASVVVRATVGPTVATRTVALIPDPTVPIAKTGDPVRLRLISGAATIEVAGKIKTGGRVGSEVTVLSATGSVHTGKLLPNNIVEIRL